MAAMTKPIPGNKDQVALGAVFRAKRSEAGVTQEQIKAALGCSINTVRWHEAGARSLRADQLVTAARVMRCDPKDLMVEGESDDDGPNAA